MSGTWSSFLLWTRRSARPLSLRDQELFKPYVSMLPQEPRYRDQMWIVHSLSPQNDLKADDLRRQLIEHAQDPSNRLMRALEEKENRTQSGFEREVREASVGSPGIT